MTVKIRLSYGANGPRIEFFQCGTGKMAPVSAFVVQYLDQNWYMLFPPTRICITLCRFGAEVVSFLGCDQSFSLVPPILLWKTWIDGCGVERRFQKSVDKSAMVTSILKTNSCGMDVTCWQILKEYPWQSWLWECSRFFLLFLNDHSVYCCLWWTDSDVTHIIIISFLSK